MPRVIADARVLAVACPRCGRAARDRCLSTYGQATSTHSARIRAAYPGSTS